MTLVLADRVKETSATTGTGTLTLAGAASGFQSFAAVGNGNQTYYAIVLGADWEVGIGTYTAAGTLLSRDTVLASSNANALVSFPAGTKDVFVTLPSSKAATIDSIQTFTGKTLVDPIITGTITEDIFAITDAAAFEINPGNGSIQTITLGASRTPKGTSFTAGESVTLMVNDGTAYALTWTDTSFGGSGVVWLTSSGTAPTLKTTGYTAIVLWKVGSQVYGKA